MLANHNKKLSICGITNINLRVADDIEVLVENEHELEA